MYATERADVLAFSQWFLSTQKIFKVVLTTEDEIAGNGSQRKRRIPSARPAASGIVVLQWNSKHESYRKSAPP